MSPPNTGSPRLDALEYLKRICKPKSLGLCVKIVRRAVQLSLDLEDKPTGIANAKDYGPWLEKHGYKRTDLTYQDA